MFIDWTRLDMIGAGRTVHLAYVGKDPMARIRALVLVAALVTGLAILHFLFGAESAPLKRLAVAADVESVLTERDGRPIQYMEVRGESPCADLAAPLDGAVNILWLGASQLYFVASYSPGDRNAVGYLAEALEPDTKLSALTMPNENLKEMYLVLRCMVRHTRIDALILAAVFDDMQEAGLRAGLEQVLKETALPNDASPLVRRLSALAGRRKEDAARAVAGAPRGIAAEQASVSLLDRSESALNALLEDNWGLWKSRIEARADTFMALRELRYQLGVLRHRLMGLKIEGVSVPVSESAYTLNWEAGRALLALARDSGIRFLVYFAPLPSDAYFPYDRDQYEKFRADIAAATLAAGGRFADLEDLVGENTWGTWPHTFGRRKKDLFHFNTNAHAALAEAVKAYLPYLTRIAK